MIEKKYFRNILRVLVLAGLMCMFPVFSAEVLADPSVMVYKADGTEATPGVDYKIEGFYDGVDRLFLIKNNLTIASSSYPVMDICGDSGTHVYTLKNLDITVSANGGNTVAALDFANNTLYPSVQLYVEGSCTIVGSGSGTIKGIVSIGDLQILSKPGGASDSLAIYNVNDGIGMNYDVGVTGKHSMTLGDNSGHSLDVTINSSGYALTGADHSSHVGPLTINKGVSLDCIGGESISTGYALVDNYSRYDINGTVSLKLDYDAVGYDDGKGVIKLRGTSSDCFKIGPYADVYLSSTGKAAIINVMDNGVALDKNTLGVTILGSEYPRIEEPFESTIISAMENGIPGYSVIENGVNSPAKSVRIRSAYSKSGMIDYDTFKSEAPGKTVIATDEIGSQTFFELKVHSVDNGTMNNQKLIAQRMVKQNANILLTQSIYPRRDLSDTENGSIKYLIWNNLPKNQAGPVCAVVYNQTDGAYVINGTLDTNGTATFYGFKLRCASTVTICK